MNKYVASAALVLTASTPAFAQELTYANADLGFAFLAAEDDVESIEGSATVLQGDIEYVVGQFFFGVSGALVKQETDFFEIDEATLGVQVGYMPIEGVLVGAAFAQSNTTFSLNGPEQEQQESTVTEIFGQYESAQFDVAATYLERETEGFTPPSFTELLGRAYVTPEVILLAGIELVEDADSTFYDLGVRYEAGPIEAVASYASNTDSDFGFLSLGGGYDVNDQIVVQATYETQTGDDFDASYITLEGAYEINDLFTVKGFYEFETGSDAFDGAFLLIGADYEFTDYATASVEYGRVLNADFEQSVLFLTLSYEFGETARIDDDIKDDFDIDSVFDGVAFGGQG